ncbi:transposase [Rhodoblastus sp.]|uniref:IS110 family transposase n=1 Tax=Rhodoblastus sp. TaxID=1962975 RepID=UPI0031455CDE
MGGLCRHRLHRRSLAAIEPATIIQLLRNFGAPFKRVGLEAGPTSSWQKAGLSAMRNKTDRNDARGIAQLVRLGRFRQVHIKSEEAQRTRMLLVNRQQLLTKALDIENSVRGSLKAIGLRVGVVTRRGVEARALELVADDPILLSIDDAIRRRQVRGEAGFGRDF